jgi:hypothetical protein
MDLEPAASKRKAARIQGDQIAVSVYLPERDWPRLVPENAVMVSIYVGTEQAYGLLANISEAGACVVSGINFEPGNKVLLRVGFDNESEPFSSEAKVVWSRDESESDKKATFVIGLKFDIMSEEQRNLLKSVLARPGFKPTVPGKPHLGKGLDDMMMDLGEALDGLGSKVLPD